VILYSTPTPEETLMCRITACAIATSCCKSDVPSQWEGQNFDPPLLPHFSTDFNETQNKKDIRDTTPHAKFGRSGTTGRGSA